MVLRKIAPISKSAKSRAPLERFRCAAAINPGIKCVRIKGVSSDIGLAILKVAARSPV